MTKVQKEKIQKLRSQGISYGEIARKINLNINTVKSYCRRIAGDNNAPISVLSCQECGKLIQQTQGRKLKRFCYDNCRMKCCSEKMHVNKYVQITERIFWCTERRTENTAPTNATLLTDSEGRIMTKDEIIREGKYQATMRIAQKMLAQGFITTDEYEEVDKMLLEKYNPLFDTLFPSP